MKFSEFHLHVLRLQPPRSCADYLSEYRHCRSLMNRLHHYYTFGRAPSCQQWKTDHYSCCEWERHRGSEAKEALRDSERARVEQQRGFVPVWELRQTPPADWHAPLQQGKLKGS
nr:PREDICTED: UPF0545 protein C22orf39 homolog [Lepisosteus oculatus]